MPGPDFNGPDQEAAHNIRDLLVIDCSRVFYIECRAYYNEKDLKTVKFILPPTKNNHQEGDKQNTSGGRESRIVSRFVCIEFSAFAFCRSLESLYSLPSSLLHIGQSVFCYCIRLKHVDLPDGLRTIGKSAFMDCCALVTIRIPLTITAIAEQTFDGCIELRSLELPPTLNSIGFAAFRDCSSLVNICLPTSVEKLPRHSFSRCTPLATKLLTLDNQQLLQSLQTRFDDLPLHKLCYYQSYYNESSSREELLSELQEILSKNGGDDSSGDRRRSCLLKKDALGMNPFHVLALSARPNKDLTSILLNHARRKFVSSGSCVSHDVLADTDEGGNDPLSYACRNMSPGSGEVVAQLLKVIHSIPIARMGYQKWRSKIHWEIDRLFVGGERLSDGKDYNPDTNFESRQRRTKQVDQNIHSYITKERLALLELAIWNRSLLQFACEKTTHLHDREDCRMTSRSNVILSNVVGFLHHL